MIQKNQIELYDLIKILGQNEHYKWLFVFNLYRKWIKFNFLYCHKDNIRILLNLEFQCSIQSFKFWDVKVLKNDCIKF